MVEDLVKNLDSSKKKQVEKVQHGMREVLSLTSEGSKTERGDPPTGTMDTIDENAGEGEPHFHSRNIGHVLDNLGLAFGYANATVCLKAVMDLILTVISDYSY